MNDQPLWVEPFIRELSVHGLINTAATAVGVTRRAVNKLRETSAEFEYEVENALEAAADELELEARRRAVEGIEKGVYYMGDQVATETQYSDGLLTTLLKAKRADEFAERKQITGAGGKPLTVVVRSFGLPPEAPDPDPLPDGIIDAEYLQIAGPPAVSLAEVLDMV